jgi:hypothetical protein
VGCCDSSFALKSCASRAVAFLAGFTSLAVNYDRQVSKTAITVMQFYSTDYSSASCCFQNEQKVYFLPHNAKITDEHAVYSPK